MRWIYAVLAIVSVATYSAKADSIALWTFESPNTPADATDFATYPNPIAPAVGSGNASGVHASALTDWTTPAGNGSANSLSATNWAIGDYYQFSTSTVGFTNIMLSWDQTSSNTGPRDFQLAFSTDGTTYTDIGSTLMVVANAAPNPVWNATTSSALYSFSYDLSSESDLNNAANVYFRLLNSSTVSANGGTVAAGGTNRVDNFHIMGTPEGTPVPVPPTLLLIATSLPGLICLRRRRRV